MAQSDTILAAIHSQLNVFGFDDNVINLAASKVTNPNDINEIHEFITAYLQKQEHQDQVHQHSPVCE